jgi:hypothetical protein
MLPDAAKEHAMPRFLKNLFATKPAPARRLHGRLSIEALEDRQLLAYSIWGDALATTAYTFTTTAPAVSQLAEASTSPVSAALSKEYLAADVKPILNSALASPYHEFAPEATVITQDAWPYEPPQDEVTLAELDSQFLAGGYGGVAWPHNPAADLTYTPIDGYSDTWRDVGVYTMVPNLESSPGAERTIYLDFWGEEVKQDWLYPRKITATQPDAIQWQASNPWINLKGFKPMFDLDGDAARYSGMEQQVITEIWQRVAEDFAPFAVNVTTSYDGSFADGKALRVAIGGSFGLVNMTDGIGFGVSRLGSFSDPALPNTAFVFSDRLETATDDPTGAHGRLARAIANVASREAGHALGLEYAPGSSGIMGTAFENEHARWERRVVTQTVGEKPIDRRPFQDDMDAIYSKLGYYHDGDGGASFRAMDLGHISPANHSQTRDGIIGVDFTANGGPSEQIPDTDWYTFTTHGGTMEIGAHTIAKGSNLTLRMNLYKMDHTTDKLSFVATCWDGANVSMKQDLAGGAYFLSISNNGWYGSLGQYTMSLHREPSWVALENLGSGWQSMAAMGDGIDWTDALWSEPRADLSWLALDPAMLHEEPVAPERLHDEPQMEEVYEEIAGEEPLVVVEEEASADELLVEIIDETEAPGLIEEESLAALDQVMAEIWAEVSLEEEVIASW